MINGHRWHSDIDLWREWLAFGISDLHIGRWNATHLYHRHRMYHTRFEMRRTIFWSIQSIETDEKYSPMRRGMRCSVWAKF
jgi:hypothetical protein